MPGLGAEYPLCAGDGDPAAVVDCVVLDRSALAVAAADDGSSVAGPPEAGRLVSFDARTGERLGSRSVPPVSGWAGDASVHALASVTSGALVVTAWEPGARWPASRAGAPASRSTRPRSRARR
ncbi:hypothetical protein [Cellulomonas sp. ES6]|uniref:hypothetical protein n=1 Tax=Cellulomonas sp. ES6 TaxID=3039384 RepID=UPI0024B7BFB8|nr:hypothetical protein [Cellulomonas sp. ES6]WHP19086.1 hypothetical protein P9841_08265 [Cellulomonas sp. ES6]